jgi:AcrR family transcriptional regulator
MPKASRYHHGNLRAALLVEARALLETSGPASLSLREIARRVGVAAPSSYHHFASLDAIAVALAEQGFSELAEQLEKARNEPAGKLAPVGVAYIAFARANPGLYRMMFGDGLRQTTAESDSLRPLRQRAYETVKAGLAKRMPADKVGLGALFLWSLIHGLALLTIDGQIEANADLDETISGVLGLAGTGIPPAP